MTVCLKQRKHVTLTQNIGKMVKKTNYDGYTIGNVHTCIWYNIFYTSHHKNKVS